MGPLATAFVYKPFWLWMGQLLGGILISWLFRVFIWKTFMENQPEMEEAPQP